MTISLLPHTGIQVIELGSFTRKELTDWNDANLGGRWEIGSKMVDGFEPPSTAQRPVVQPDDEIDLDDDDEGQVPTPASQAAPATQRTRPNPVLAIALAAEHGGWLPLPMSANSALWAMVWVKINETRRTADGEESYDLAIAIDTTTTTDGAGGTLRAPDLPQTFRIEPFRPNNFWLSPSVEGFVRRGAATLTEKRKWGDGRARTSTAQALQLDFLAFYAFVARTRVVEVSLDGPDDRPEAQARQPVPVTLVVDVGNTRTCGVLTEPDQGMQGQYRFTVLEVRRLPRRPLDIVRRPFPTRLAFTQPGYGVLSAEDGAATFADLSVVRLGEDAVDALHGADGDFGVRGMSSPKRYLWDGHRRDEPWEFAAPMPIDVSPRIAGALLAHLGDGDPFKRPTLVMPELATPPSPAYPRKTGMLFAFVELLEHAYRQANSPEYRQTAQKQPGSQRRRVIQHVVAMHPAGMHSKEIKEFRAAVELAGQIWSEFRTDPVAFSQGKPVAPSKRVPVPRFHASCDEGFAIQAYFLYGEAQKRFHGEASHFMRTYGRTVNDGRQLRLASIDVGGGTIDLAIADYSIPARAFAQPNFAVDPLYHDGISRAGDDIARALLELAIFPAIAKQMGLRREEWNGLFGPVSDGGDPGWRLVRRRLVTGVWLPLVHEVLGHIEREGKFNGAVAALLKRYDSAAVESLHRHVDRFTGRSRRCNLDQVELGVTHHHLYGAAWREIGVSIAQFADVVAQFRCDAVVVGGRAAAMPAVKRLIVESLPCPPGALVFLHEQAVGDWFRFAIDGRVGDSKTCAVFGAAVAFHAQMRLGEMIMNFPSERRSPPNVLGVFNPGRAVLKKDLALFNPGTLEGRLSFQHGDVIVGARRVDAPMAMARPVYRIGLDRRLARQWQAQPVADATDLELTLSRSAPFSDDLAISDIVGELHVPNAAGGTTVLTDFNQLRRHVRCELQTMLVADHWLDSGSFEDIEIDHDQPVQPVR